MITTRCIAHPASLYEPTPFSEMQSACPPTTATKTRVDAAHRLDPYYTTMWDSGSQAAWTTRAQAERRQKEGLPMRAPDRAFDYESGLEQFLRTRMRQQRLDTLACCRSWRTLTVEQMAAMVDVPAWVNRQTDLRAGVAAGLLDWGVIPKRGVGDKLALDGRFWFYRQGAKPAYKKLARQLTAAENGLLDDGLTLCGGCTQQDRHNILTAELALRIAEFCEIAAVLGEAHAAFAKLAKDRGTTVALRTTGRRAADLIATRTDGYQIAVELTATINEKFREKVLAWVQFLLALGPDSALMVIFVEAGHHEHPSRHTSIQQMRDVISAAVYETPGASRARIGAQIGLARWSDWCPEAVHGTTAFKILAGERPTGARGDRWEPYAALDPLDVWCESPSRPDLMVDRMLRSVASAANPHWLRPDRAAPTQQFR